MDQNRAFFNFVEQPHLIRLYGRTQNYTWGGFDFIPELLRQSNSDRQPFAELWIGAHPKLPSLAEVSGFEMALDALIAANPLQILGPQAAVLFEGKLPYLFKVLDVRQMLSIQVHPTDVQAKKGFERENRKQIPLVHPERNYKDPFHKPEVHVALTDFWMLHGFRPLVEVEKILRTTSGFELLDSRYHKLAEKFSHRDERLSEFYRFVMNLPQSQVDRMIGALLKSIAPLFKKGTVRKSSPHYWAMQAVQQFPSAGGHFDAGLFSIYLFNLIRIPPGRGTFQAAGVPHAYLEGVTVELMANSDNVLRGGLTNKYVDVKELLKTLQFHGAKPEILKGRKASLSERIFPVPIPDFLLSQITLEPQVEYKSKLHHGPDIILLMEGDAWAFSRGQSLPMQRGDIVFVPADVPYTLRSSRNTKLFKATVPLGLPGE
jgi:mannose-6-phosphate isomerase